MWISQQVSRELQDYIVRTLEPRERVQWADKPIPHFFSRTALSVFLFAIPWTVFSVFWVAAAAMGVLSEELPGLFLLFPLFGVPFVLVGLGMLSAPLLNYRKMARTLYVITNRRVMFIEQGRAIKMQAFWPEGHYDLTRKENRDGSGDLVAQARHTPGAAKLVLLGIRDVRMAEAYLQPLLQ